MGTEQGGLPEKSVEGIGLKVQGIVNESRMPTEGFQSTVGIYGGRLTMAPFGAMVYDTRGVVSKVDRWGDPKLRTYDEHTVRNPVKLLKRHPAWFFRFIHPGPKRYRGSQAEMLAHINELGLDEYYGLHPWGIEVKKPEVFQKGITLQDIYRQDLIRSERITCIDRFQALAAAARYARAIHDQHGAIGELLPSDIIFQTREDKQVINPVLNIPDIVYNPKKQFGRTEQEATDLLDFLVSIGVEELRRSGDWNEVERALKTTVESYGGSKVIHATGSLAKRGRLTLKGVAFYLHNRFRLAMDKDISDPLRLLIEETC